MTLLGVVLGVMLALAPLTRAQLVEGPPEEPQNLTYPPPGTLTCDAEAPDIVIKPVATWNHQHKPPRVLYYVLDARWVGPPDDIWPIQMATAACYWSEPNNRGIYRCEKRVALEKWVEAPAGYQIQLRVRAVNQHGSSDPSESITICWPKQCDFTPGSGVWVEFLTPTGEVGQTEVVTNYGEACLSP